jgi:Photosynthesis system II assembly factor YCF48
MPSDDRDQQFERALARHLSHPSGDAACPDAEILAAYHERSLSIEEMSHWKEHIAACARCREALSLVEQTENVVTTGQWHELEPVAQLTAAEVMPKRSADALQASASFSAPAPAPQVTPVRKLPPRAAWSWIVPLGAVAASVIVWVGVHEIRTQRVKETQIALNRLPATLPAAPQVSGKEQLKKDEAPVTKTENRVTAQKSLSPAPSASPIQSPSPAKPSSGNELARSARKEPRPAAVAGALEAPPSVSSYAADTGALQANAPPAPTAEPSAPAALASNVSAQQNEESKKAQSLRAKTAPQLQAAGVPAMTQAQMVAAPNQDLVQAALANRRYIVAPGEKHAWRLGDGGLIEVSTDRGKTWKPQSSGVTADLTAGSATSDKVCWVVGKSGTLLLTADGGKHWNLISSPITSDLGGVHATDASHASIWDVSNRNSFETNDGGATWQRTANE